MSLKTSTIGIKINSLWDEFLKSITLTRVLSFFAIIVLTAIGLFNISNINNYEEECIAWLSSLDNIDTISFAFGFSFALLVLVSLIKYIVNSEWNIKDFGEYLMELPIDTCSIVITVIASLYLRMHVGKSSFLIIITLIIVAICSAFRKASIRNGGFEKIGKKSLIYGIIDIGVAVYWINLIFKILK